MNPLVSIIIPSYNSLQYLDASLESALQQSYKSIEVILVDDGSTDGTKDHFDRFKKMGVHCIYQDNVGPAAARNTGIKASKGEYIQFLDADDLLRFDKIEHQIEIMVSENIELSFTKWKYFHEDINDAFQESEIKINKTVFTGKELLKSFGVEKWALTPIMYLTKRSLIEKAGLWNTQLNHNEDGEFYSRILFLVDKVVYINKVCSFYRKTPGDSVGKLNSEVKVLSALKSWQIIKDLLVKDQDKTLLSYPKRGFYVIYVSSIHDFPDLAKNVAKEFDKIDQPCHLPDIKLYRWLISKFGLHIGFRIYDFYKKLKRSISIPIRRLFGN